MYMYIYICIHICLYKHVYTIRYICIVNVLIRLLWKVLFLICQALLRQRDMYCRVFLQKWTLQHLLTNTHAHTHTRPHTHTHAHAHTHTHTHVHNYIHEHSYLVSWKELRETNLSLQVFVLEGSRKSEGSSMWNRLSIFYVDQLDVESPQILCGINSTWNQLSFYVEST